MHTVCTLSLIELVLEAKITKLYLPWLRFYPCTSWLAEAQDHWVTWIHTKHYLFNFKRQCKDRDSDLDRKHQMKKRSQRESVLGLIRERQICTRLWRQTDWDKTIRGGRVSCNSQLKTELTLSALDWLSLLIISSIVSRLKKQNKSKINRKQ